MSKTDIYAVIGIALILSGVLIIHLFFMLIRSLWDKNTLVLRL
ncbi:MULTISPECIES: hypothetical protein [Vibrio]|nr:hypothetical protein [Vibrio crassostreae]